MALRSGLRAPERYHWLRSIIYGNNLLVPGTKVAPTQANLRNYSGALFGRVGDASEAFYIGDRYEGAQGREGKLYLHIVPSPWNNASTGAYQVKIATRN